MEEKKKRKMNPNSLKNLKPIAKGTVLNPIGGNAHNPIKRLTSEYFKEIIEASLLGNIEALAHIVNDPNSPALKVGVAKSLHTAIKNGSWGTLEAIISRLLGKVPDKIEFKGSVDVGSVSEEELKARIEEKRKKLQVIDE